MVPVIHMSRRDRDHRRWLMELTNLPTAAGHEDRVVNWVRAWAKGRRVTVKSDRAGNLTIRRASSASGRGAAHPIYFTAHMDHPAFVVNEVLSANKVRARFMGGVRKEYFVGSKVELFRSGSPSPVPGKVAELLEVSWELGEFEAIIELETRVSAQVGDVLRWGVGPVRVVGDRYHAPACDDLAGVAAALSAFDEVGHHHARADVRVLLTRAEEVGFIGAIAACKSGTIPKGARVFALETSKSFPDSPIGGGAIVRVGDRASTFDPELTYLAGAIAQKITADDPHFLWQRKLMTGGTCEATAYQTFGHRATCLCLPLGNYHNMNESTRRIDGEIISLADYHGLVRLLTAIGLGLDDPAITPGLKQRLDHLFEERREVLKS